MQANAQESKPDPSPTKILHRSSGQD